MKSCDYYIELISAELDNELSAEQKKELRAHLEVCAECRAVKEAFEAVSSALTHSDEPVPELMHENIMAGVRRFEIKKRNRRITSLIAACAAVIIISSAAAVNLTSRSAVYSAAAGAIPEVPAEYAVTESCAEESLEKAPSETLYDMRGRSCEELMTVLRGKPCGEMPDAEHLFTLLLEENGDYAEAEIYRFEDNIYSCFPSEGWYLLSVSDKNILDFVLYN